MGTLFARNSVCGVGPSPLLSHSCESVHTHVRLFTLMHVCSHSCTFVHTHVRQFALMYACSNPGTSVHTYVRLFTPMYVCSHSCTSVHTHVRLFTLMCVCSHSCTSVHTHVRLFTPMYVCSHICTSLHTHVRLFTPMYVSSHPCMPASGLAVSFYVTFNAIFIAISVFLASISPPLSRHLLSLPVFSSALYFYMTSPCTPNQFLLRTSFHSNLHSHFIHFLLSALLTPKIILTRLFFANLDLLLLFVLFLLVSSSLVHSCMPGSHTS